MNRLRSFPAVVAMATALLLPLAGGCQSPPMQAEMPATNDADFFMNLAYKDVATLADAYRAVAMLHAGDEDGLMAPGEARDYLVERGVVPASWSPTGGAALTKGELAYMICQALGIKGGVTMRIFGPSKRYCLYEASYQQLMAGGSDYQYVTGGELVSTIDRADRYSRRNEPDDNFDEAAMTAAAIGTSDNNSTTAAAGDADNAEEGEQQ